MAQPTETLRDGSLKATIWKNDAEKGAFYSVNLTRSYKDEQGNWHDTTSFSGTELLRIARLADLAYTKILEHREASREDTAVTAQTGRSA